jgi:hypothetical protein
MASNRCFVNVLVFTFGCPIAMRREMGCGGGSKEELPTVGIAVFGIEYNRENGSVDKRKDVILIFDETDSNERASWTCHALRRILSPRVSYQEIGKDWVEAEERREEQSEVKRMKQSIQKNM